MYDTYPVSKNPLRPARPAICMNSFFVSGPSMNFAIWPKTTVSAGRFTPRESASVPATTSIIRSRKAISTSSFSFGSIEPKYMPTPRSIVSGTFSTSSI